MGCSSCYNINEKNEIEDINNFNKIYRYKHEDNTEIKSLSEEITLFNIEQEGFDSLCSMKLIYLERLYLNNNSIENIEFLENFYVPRLKYLDLSYNKITNINIFKKVNFPLEYLDLSNNAINNIDIFKDDNTLKKLKNILLNNNDIDFNNKNINNIIIQLSKRLAINNEESFEKSNIDNNLDIELKKMKTIKYEDSFVNPPYNDKNYEVALKKMKTLNNNLKTNFGIYEKDVILKMRTIKNISLSDESIINDIELYLSNLKRSVNIIKNKPLNDVKIPKTKTMKNK